MTLSRLQQLRDILKADDDIAKLTITIEELTEIHKYQLKLLNAWGKDYSVLRTLNTMISDIEHPRVEHSEKVKVSA